MGATSSPSRSETIATGHGAPRPSRGRRRLRRSYLRTSGKSSTTGTRWAFPTPRRCRRRTRWGWTTSPSTTDRKRRRASSRSPRGGSRGRGSARELVSRQVDRSPVAGAGRGQARRTDGVRRRDAGRCLRRGGRRRHHGIGRPQRAAAGPALLARDGGRRRAVRHRAEERRCGEVGRRGTEAAQPRRSRGGHRRDGADGQGPAVHDLDGAAGRTRPWSGPPSTA